MTPDPQLGGALVYVIVLLYAAAVLWLLCWGAVALARCYRHWRARPRRPVDDGQPADAAATLASVYAALDAREQGQS